MRRNMRSSMRLILILGMALAAGIGYQNCGDSSMSVAESGISGGRAPASLNQSPTAEEDLLTLSQKDLSCTADSDCVAIQMSRRACGGFSYGVASKLSSAFDEVQRLSQEVSSSTAPVSGISTCEMRVAPIPVCRANLCVGVRAEL